MAWSRIAPRTRKRPRMASIEPREMYISARRAPACRIGAGSRFASHSAQQRENQSGTNPHQDVRSGQRIAKPATNDPRRGNKGVLPILPDVGFHGQVQEPDKARLEACPAQAPSAVGRAPKASGREKRRAPRPPYWRRTRTPRSARRLFCHCVPGVRYALLPRRPLFTSLGQLRAFLGNSAESP